MTDQTTCAAPRTAQTAELHPWDSAVLDIAGCDRTEFVVALHPEYETAGTRPETWPPAVAALFERHVAEWIAGHPARAVRAVSYGAPKQKSADGKPSRQVCVMILHHSAKG